MYHYLSNIMLLMAIAYALSMIPAAIVHSILMYVLLWLEVLRLR